MVHGFPRSDEGKRGSLLKRGLGVGHNDECLVATFVHRIRLGTAQRGNVESRPVGSPTPGGSKGVGCIVSWAAAEGRDLEASSKNVECHLFWWGKSLRWCTRLSSSY